MITWCKGFFALCFLWRGIAAVIVKYTDIGLINHDLVSLDINASSGFFKVLGEIGFLVKLQKIRLVI